MQIITDSLVLSCRGYGDMKNITPEVAAKLKTHGLTLGTVTVFVPGSTGALTTIEYEGGLVADFEEAMERIAPAGQPYHHDARWGDGNGFSHIRASLLGPSLSVPFVNGLLTLGTWQQIVFLDFDNRSRNRQLVLQFIGH
ncbi:MAG: secondary thiamine-phosphate synthase enzyme YjbQ [Acidobacteria bacterium]|nr:secondary thiamine-phosphate synthase enzyme YjbQ [Acidobacteriota bacterium]MCG2815248.1 secondary thiamine-phosphate synthase enzyme YjbQ [Candidatus Aminicenantes bacterium]MBU1474761.1 secondary thiamine-phosphate synthase enzyme YjbQ [Acidobacteriota bacterium]MBU2438102.1 secondary thiamine-phosphate synthase enzyme YjbQ [Acidobacteriota bacterium]MBU4253535.1 secondary thiamine-phosphate synthase enzyme YjbQ [Acidobacteriota bacterium]